WWERTWDGRLICQSPAGPAKAGHYHVVSAFRRTRMRVQADPNAPSGGPRPRKPQAVGLEAGLQNFNRVALADREMLADSGRDPRFVAARDLINEMLIAPR